MKYIDPHVHCRNGNQDYKTNIREVSEKARDQGIVAIFDVHPVFSKKDVQERLALVEKRDPVVAYFLYVGVTSDKNQIAEAVSLVKTYPQVIGLKMRTVAASDFPGVSRETEQFQVYQSLAELHYEGVLAVHCEKQSRLKPKLWNPSDPWTHCLAHPPEAEIASVDDQIRLARKAGFEGNLHIMHVSCPASVALVARAKKHMAVTCGATPHHLIWSADRLKEKLGLFNKADPPLRDNMTVVGLRNCLVLGQIDWLESDYAFHTLIEKLKPPYLSGIAAYELYKEILSFLKRQGASERQIADLTYWNIKRVFGEKLKSI